MEFRALVPGELANVPTAAEAMVMCAIEAPWLGTKGGARAGS